MIEKYMELFDTVHEVKHWPRILRRIFLLTIPVSLPLWWLIICAMMMFGGMLCIVDRMIGSIEEFWNE